jgi:tetratricopeptide (TPR) repeat protein
MLQVETNTRRRFALMMGAFCLLIFGLMLTGLLQRMGQIPGDSAEEDRVSEMTLAKARETSARLREVRKSLAELGKEGKWEEAITLAESKIKEIEGMGLSSLYAEALFRAGRFDKAITEYETLLPPFDAVTVADRFGMRRNISEYRRHCEELLKGTSLETDARTANNTAWACVTAKEGLEDYAKPVELARIAVAGATEDNDRWTYLNTLGVALYRAGQDKEAIERLMEAEKINSDIFNWPFLALSHHRLGNAKEAQTWRDRFHKKMDATYARPDLMQNRHELLMFLRETEEAFSP